MKPVPSPDAAGEQITVGVLALQGDFEAHGKVLARLGAQLREVRVPVDLEGLDGLVIPGGESTTISLGIEREQLAEPLRAFHASGKPIFGTCAGLIILDREHLGIIDIRAERNAFGRQVRSFEAPLEIGLAGGPVEAIFIRAPWIDQHGPSVEILAEVEGHGVAAREGTVLVVAFHPELGDDDRVHELFLQSVRDARLAAA